MIDISRVCYSESLELLDNAFVMTSFINDVVTAAKASRAIVHGDYFRQWQPYNYAEPRNKLEINWLHTGGGCHVALSSHSRLAQSTSLLHSGDASGLLHVLPATLSNGVLHAEMV